MLYTCRTDRFYLSLTNIIFCPTKEKLLEIKIENVKEIIHNYIRKPINPIHHF